MGTVMFYFLIVCVALLALAAWLASGAWSIAIFMLGPTAPTVIVFAVVGASLMGWSRRSRITVPMARVLVRRRFAKGASL